MEEALGNAVDLNTAFREGAFGDDQKPFIGYLFVLEECPKSTSSVRDRSSPHFPVRSEFQNTSYAQRYEILCRKLVQEQFYDSASLLLTRSEDAETGMYRCLSEATGARRFAAKLAGTIAAMSES